jgi:hypothetical protein
MAIAGGVAVCLEAFRKLLASTAQEEQAEKHAIIVPQVSDEFGRFKVWSSNIGAHRSGRSSLDYRLRDASHIQKRVLQLLADLSQSLDEGKCTKASKYGGICIPQLNLTCEYILTFTLASAIASGETIPWDEMPSESEKPSDGDEPTTPEDEMASTELGQIVMDVNEINTDLLRLSKAMRNPAPHERFLNAVSTDTSYFNEHDKRHVQDKFPKADPTLLIKLAKAISRRRQFFKYREQHQSKLRKGLLTEHDDTSTVASSLPSQMRYEKLSIVDIAESGSESGLSQTSYSDSVEDPSRPHVPSLASKYMDGKPFECPICFLIITISSSHAWK